MIRKRFVILLALLFIISITASVGSVSTVGNFFTLIDDDTLHTNNESWNVSIGKNGTTIFKLYVNGSTSLDGTTFIDDGNDFIIDTNKNLSLTILNEGAELFINHSRTGAFYTPMLVGKNGIFDVGVSIHKFLDVVSYASDVDAYMYLQNVGTSTLSGFALHPSFSPIAMEIYTQGADIIIQPDASGLYGDFKTEVNFDRGKCNFTVHGTIKDNLLFINAFTNRIGINTTDPLQLLSVNGSIGLAENLTFGSQRMYNYSNDLYINNTVNNKGIVFSVNSGGVQKDFMTVGGAIPSLTLDAGDFSGGPAQAILKISGTAKSGIANMPMYFIVNMDGASSGFIAQGTIGYKQGGSGIGIQMVNSMPTINTGNYYRTGFNSFIQSPRGTATSGAYTDTGILSYLEPVNVFPTDTYLVDYDAKSIHAKRGALSFLRILPFFDGSWRDVSTYGLYIEGWGNPSDNFDGVNGTINDYAIYSDGGDTYFGEGEHTFTGTVNISNTLKYGNIHYAEMWMHNDISPNVTILQLEDVWYNTTAFNQPDNGTSLNGFTYANSNLTCLISGKYKVDFSLTHSGSVNNKYHFAIGLNGQPQFNTETHERMGTANDITSCSSSGFIDITVNDKISLQIMNEDVGNNATIYSINVNLIRIGDI